MTKNEVVAKTFGPLTPEQQGCILGYGMLNDPRHPGDLVLCVQVKDRARSEQLFASSVHSTRLLFFEPNEPVILQA